MKRRTIFIPFRKKRIGRTNYKKRLQLLRAQKPRLVVRRSLRHIVLQLVQFTPESDRIVASAHSSALVRFGWTASTGNLPVAYLTGLLLAKRAKSAGVMSGVVDIGFHTSVRGSCVYAAVKGARDGGLQIAADEKMFPDEHRIRGEHIVAYQKKVVDGKSASSVQFSRHKGDAVPSLFDKVKAAIEADTNAKKQG